MKKLLALAIVLVTGCAAMDDALNTTMDQAYNDAVCTTNMCADDEICVEMECHLRCKVDDECEAGEGCLPTADGRTMCWDRTDYERQTGIKL